LIEEITMTAAQTTDHQSGHNGGPPLDDEAAIFASIDDLYGEAKNWADGEPIGSQEVADEVTKLYDGLHDLGKKAEALRVEEKRPLDEKIDAIQAKYNPYVQAKKGKVALGKDTLGALLTAWRTKVAAEKAAAAEKARMEADAERRKAEEEMRASAGNLEARERAEEQLAFAKDAEKFARRTERAASDGLGLRTVWVATMADASEAIDWAYGKDAGRFIALAQAMAEEAVRSGARTIPGFSIKDEKRAI
jgi:hypothetical protein